MCRLHVWIALAVLNAIQPLEAMFSLVLINFAVYVLVLFVSHDFRQPLPFVLCTMTRKCRQAMYSNEYKRRMHVG